MSDEVPLSPEQIQELAGVYPSVQAALGTELWSQIHAPDSKNLFPGASENDFTPWGEAAGYLFGPEKGQVYLEKKLDDKRTLHAVFGPKEIRTIANLIRDKDNPIPDENIEIDAYPASRLIISTASGAVDLCERFPEARLFYDPDVDYFELDNTQTSLAFYDPSSRQIFFGPRDGLHIFDLWHEIGHDQYLSGLSPEKRQEHIKACALTRKRALLYQNNQFSPSLIADLEETHGLTVKKALRLRSLSEMLATAWTKTDLTQLSRVLEINETDANLIDTHLELCLQTYDSPVTSETSTSAATKELPLETLQTIERFEQAYQEITEFAKKLGVDFSQQANIDSIGPNGEKINLIIETKGIFIGTISALGKEITVALNPFAAGFRLKLVDQPEPIRQQVKLTLDFLQQQPLEARLAMDNIEKTIRAITQAEVVDIRHGRIPLDLKNIASFKPLAKK